MSVKTKVDFLKQLLYLREVVCEQSISSAAIKNGIKAPNLSKMMKNLEQDLQKILLIRTSHGVTPTTDALKIVFMAEKIEKDLMAISTEIKEKCKCSVPKLFVAKGLKISKIDHFGEPFDMTELEEKADVLVCPYKPKNADQLITVQNNIGTSVVQKIWVCCRNQKTAIDLAQFVILQIHEK